MAIIGNSTRDGVSPQGLVLGGFELVEKIGEGGMGEVWRARNVKVASVVRAVKLIRPEFGRDPQFRERFLREAEYLELLRHPNIMRVDNIGEEAGYLFMVMELLHGHGVEHFIGGTSVPVACRILYEASLGVAKAHQHNIFHRDLKPSNLFLTSDGEVRVLDFGIARHEGKNRLTMTSASQPGTPAYYAPEMVMGKPSSGASDVYALGISLFELLTGRQPFEPDPSVDGSQAINFMMYSHVNTPLPDARMHRPEVPAALQALLVKLTDKDPSRRPSDAKALARALTAHFDAAEPLVYDPEGVGSVWRDGVRHPMLVALPPAIHTGPRRSLQEAMGAEGTYVPATPAPATARASRSAPSLRAAPPASPPLPGPAPVARRHAATPPPDEVPTQLKATPWDSNPRLPRELDGASDETTEYRVQTELRPLPEQDDAPLEEDEPLEVPRRAPAWLGWALGGAALLGVGAYALTRHPTPTAPELRPVEKRSPAPVDVRAPIEVKVPDVPRAAEARPEPVAPPQPPVKEPEVVKPSVAVPPPKAKRPADDFVVASPVHKPLGMLHIKPAGSFRINDARGHKELGTLGGFKISIDYVAEPGGLRVTVNTDPSALLVPKGSRSLGGSPQSLLLGSSEVDLTLSSANMNDEPHLFLSFDAAH